MAEGLLKEWLHTIKERAGLDYDTVIVLTGKERSGKSTLAYKLGMELDPTFEPDRMLFTGQDLVEKAESLPPGSVVVLDEAISGGFSRDAMSKPNKAFTKFLFICGERNLILIICFPNINYMDRIISNHRMHYWGLVIKRGKCIMHKPLPTDFRGSKPFDQPLFGFNYTGLKDHAGFERYQAMKHEMVGDRAKDLYEDSPSSDPERINRFTDAARTIASRGR